ncbi:MAG: glucose-6-phosphate isomerase [Zoogloea sp.]|nr:glucose-6-phosphate isomerase [Zoogloea sp.]
MPAALALKKLAANRTFRLKDLFSADAGRFVRFSRSLDGLLLDFSRQRLDDEVFAGLLELAGEAELSEGIRALLGGETVNFTEGRPALHAAARLAKETPEAARASISAVLQRIEDFSAKVREGRLLGATGKPIRSVVHVGIGGSDLGPRLLLEALTPPGATGGPLKVHFAANVDEAEIQSVLALANPEETLFILASKSFVTQETLYNAGFAKSWLRGRLGEQAELASHFVGLTNNVTAARAFGIRDEQIFPLPEWIGGRYSIWSAIGLPVLLALGADTFRQFLAGGRAMDHHFAEAPFAENLPVLLALAGIWNASFLGLESLAVLPYAHGLRSFPSYLQQLEMESNGKSVTRDGEPVSWGTSPIVWGGAGTVGQHAYHQLLYQGTRTVAIDFIVPLGTDTPAQRALVGNALAQGAALMHGRTRDEAHAELSRQGLPASEVERLAPHLACAGNQPSSTLLIPEMTPFRLGQLVALYEHKVFAQGWIWGINSFDQYGVELGKQMARRLAEGGSDAADSSTAGLLSCALAHWQESGVQAGADAS